MGDATGRPGARRPSGSGSGGGGLRGGGSGGSASGGAGTARRRSREPQLTRARPRTVVAVTTSMLGLSSTRRAVILAVVVCAVALTVVVPLRNFVAGRQELAAVQAQEQALRDDVAALTAEQQRLADPAETEALARTRLGYAMPGEVPYVVQLPAAPAGAAPDGSSGTPWYRTLWREVTAGAP